MRIDTRKEEGVVARAVGKPKLDLSPTALDTGGPLQANLVINDPGDESERVPELVAGQVTRIPAPGLCRGRPSTSGRIGISTREFMEQRFGDDFGHVQYTKIRGPRILYARYGR